MPLVEAMHFGIPIVAYSSSAVPETLGRGGLLLDDKDPVLAAAAIDRIVRDEALRKILHTEQQRKLREYDSENVRNCLTRCLKKATA